MSVEVILFMSGIVFVAASLQGITGFGFMLLSLPGVILYYPAQVAVPALLIVYLPLGLVQWVHLRRDIDRRLLAYLLFSALLGLPLGAMILRDTDTEMMKRILGGVMVLLAFLLRVRPGEPFKDERPARIGIGFMSGVLAASTSVSGPPVVLLGLKQRWEPRAFRATLLAYFFFVGIFCLPFHWHMNLLNPTSIQLALSGLPGIFLGFFVGVWMRGRVAPGAFRWLASAMVLGGGLVAIFI
ncbi:MAG: sulfite exporter TauE/SafE family protein [bacterium]|nr:sulfite exporter TauE/SafE family protein [bacterium]